MFTVAALIFLPALQEGARRGGTRSLGVRMEPGLALGSSSWHHSRPLCQLGQRSLASSTDLAYLLRRPPLRLALPDHPPTPVLGSSPVSGRVLRDNYLHCLHPHARSRGAQHWPSLCWAGEALPSPTLASWPHSGSWRGLGDALPRGELAWPSSTQPISSGPKPQSRFLGTPRCLAGCGPTPALKSPSPCRVEPCARGSHD